MDQLRKWLRDPAANLFRLVLKARWQIFALEAGLALAREAAAAAMPIKGESQHIADAKVAAATAAMMRAAIDVLDLYTAIGAPDSTVAPDSHYFRLILNVPAA